MAANEPLNELSTTDASNTPVGTDVVGSTLDNELRSIKANIARSARWEQTATQSVAVTLAVSALHKLFPVEGSVGGSTTITLPEVASAGAGFSVAFKKIDNVNDVIIDGNGAEQIDGAASRTMKAQYEGLVLVCNGSSWDVAADGERLVVPSFTVDGALNTGTLFVNGNEVTGLEGTVPAPANPGEDTYLLEANGGTWAWQSPANVKTNMSFGALADLNTVNTAQIDNDAVTLGKLEHGTSGDILYYGASGEPFRLAKGTDAQILTLASGLPSWADAAAGGMWEFVETNDLTGGSVAAVTTTVASGYDYMWILRDISPAVDNRTLGLRTDSDGGASYDSGSSDYRIAIAYAAQSGSWNPNGGLSTYMQAGPTSQGNLSNEALDGFIVMMNPAGAQYTKIYAQGVCGDTADQIRGGVFWGWRHDATAVNSVEIKYQSSGDFAATGEIEVWRRQVQ